MFMAMIGIHLNADASTDRQVECFERHR